MHQGSLKKLILWKCDKTNKDDVSLNKLNNFIFALMWLDFKVEISLE